MVGFDQVPIGIPPIASPTIVISPLQALIGVYAWSAPMADQRLSQCVALDYCISPPWGRGTLHLHTQPGLSDLLPVNQPGYWLGRCDAKSKLSTARTNAPPFRSSSFPLSVIS